MGSTSDSPASYDGGPIYEAVEAAQPIAANLIEFPREIVATRRMRPRITEASLESTEPQQLSIFEVDPNTVSREPMFGYDDDNRRAHVDRDELAAD